MEKLEGVERLQIGVLALQGDFKEHMVMLAQFADIVNATEVRKKEHL